MVCFPGMWSRRKVGVAVGVVAVLALAVVAMAVLPPGGDGGNADGGSAVGGNGDGGGTGTPTGGASNATGTADLPPGIGETGVVDGDALLSAHREGVMESGFAYRYVHRMTERGAPGGPETTIDVRGVVRSTANLSTVERRTNRSAPVEERVVSWTNGTASGERTVADGTTYEAYVPSPTWRVTLHYVAINHLPLARWNLSGVRRADGATRFVLVANDTRRVDDGSGTDDVKAYSARMVVDPAGRIRRFEVNVTTARIVGEEGNRYPLRSTRHFVYELTTVGNVSVPPPDWLDRVGRVVGAHPRGEPAGTG